MKVTGKESIPEKMKAVVLTEFGAPLEVKELPTPKPGKGQVLIKMYHSPVNPSDDSFIKGEYSSAKKPPVVPGLEGSGKVVSSGGGFMANRVLGKVVAAFAPMDKDGTWAEYMVTDAKLVVPLQKGLDPAQASMMFVNPLTAYAFVQIAKKKKQKAILNTPGAGALGQMLSDMCRENGIELVNIVRKQTQVDLLTQMGHKHVLNSDSPTFDKDLKTTLRDLDVKLAFDGIGGDLTDRILTALPKGGEIQLYGRLSDKDSMLSVGSFIFEKKSVTGFWLTHWIQDKNPVQLLMIFPKIQKFLNGNHQIRINRHLSLDQVQSGITEYKEEMTKGKMLVSPWSEHP